MKQEYVTNRLVCLGKYPVKCTSSCFPIKSIHYPQNWRRVIPCAPKWNPIQYCSALSSKGLNNFLLFCNALGHDVSKKRGRDWRLGSPIKRRSQTTFERFLPWVIKRDSWQQRATANMVLFSSLCSRSSLLFTSHRLSCFFEQFPAITLSILSLLLSFRFRYYFVHTPQPGLLVQSKSISPICKHLSEAPGEIPTQCNEASTSSGAAASPLLRFGSLVGKKRNGNFCGWIVPTV